MRVIHLLKSNSYSGAENVACQIIDLFKDDKDIEMIYVCPKGAIKETLVKRKIKYFLMSGFTFLNVLTAIKILKPDIIHAHDYSATVFASVISAFIPRKIRIISHLHNNASWIGNVNFFSVIFALSSVMVDRYLLVSESISKEYIFSNIFNNRYDILPNAVDKNRILKKSEEFDVDEDIDILFAGRLSSEKNPLKALNIIRSVHKRKNINAAVIGDGELRGQCENYVRENHMTGYVSFIGYTENPYPYMKKAKILLMPSDWEGFGLVAVEAMILGTPVVCSGVGGLKDIVSSECGFVCHSYKQYVNRITDLLNNYSVCSGFINNSKKRSERYADLELYKESILKSYVINNQCCDFWNGEN